jgi:hypothetical protein
MSQNAVYSRSVLWLPMTGPSALWCGGSYGTPHVLAFSAILCSLRMSLEHWAFWDGIFAVPGRAYRYSPLPLVHLIFTYVQWLRAVVHCGWSSSGRCLEQ